MVGLDLLACDSFIRDSSGTYAGASKPLSSKTIGGVPPKSATPPFVRSPVLGNTRTRIGGNEQEIRMTAQAEWLLNTKNTKKTFEAFCRTRFA